MPLDRHSSTVGTGGKCATVPLTRGRSARGCIVLKLTGTHTHRHTHNTHTRARATHIPCRFIKGTHDGRGGCHGLADRRRRCTSQSNHSQQETCNPKMSAYIETVYCRT